MVCGEIASLEAPQLPGCLLAELCPRWGPYDLTSVFSWAPRWSLPAGAPARLQGQSLLPGAEVNAGQR